MKYFLLPNNNIHINPHDIKVSYDISYSICNSLNHYLNKSKNRISNHIKLWDTYKKYTNTYEFIHTQIPLLKNSVSKHKPLSRSYFKMIEIINTFNILDQYKDKNITSFHLAEGPGGFIEALAYMRKNIYDKYIGITLLDTDSSIPNWGKCKDIIKKYPNIVLEYGADKTGDILSNYNLTHCFNKYANSIDIITGDGGFDFSLDFNNQEKQASNLVFAEICFAILLQKKGGTFILKCFDIFYKSSIDIMYILSSFYDNIYISKPCTSRQANSEKYLICKNFKYSDTTMYYNVIYNIFSNNLKYNYISSYLDITPPYFYINKLQEINCLLGQAQIENINSTIDMLLCERKCNEKLDILKKKNISKCVEWCISNNIPYNTTYIYNNYYDSIK